MHTTNGDKMKEFPFESKERSYEFSEDKKYKRMHIDFNEYGFNRYEKIEPYTFTQTSKTGPNCVNRPTKR